MSATAKKSVFTKSKTGEIVLNAKTLPLPNVKKLKSGAYKNRPMRAFVINHSINANIMGGLDKDEIGPGKVITYLDSKGKSAKLEIECITFGHFNGLTGKTLIQFDIVG